MKNTISPYDDLLLSPTIAQEIDVEYEAEQNNSSYYISPFQNLVIENEFYDYESVDEAIIEDENKDAYYQESDDEEKINRNVESEELEEAFAFGLDKLKANWQKLRNATATSKSLPTVSPEGRRLLLSIVSSYLPDSTNYLKTKLSPERYYGIPETIAALQWIGKEWVQQHSNVKFIIRDISQMGGGRISGHGSHRMGIDADIRLSINGKLISSRAPNYQNNRKYVRNFINIVKQNPYLSIAVIGFQDSVLNREFARLVNPWKNHSKHLHLRFCRPLKRLSNTDFRKVYPKGSKGSFKTCGENDVKFTDPVLSSAPTTKPASTNNTSGEDFSTIPNKLGTLQIDTSVPELTKSIPSYKFTKEDALWLARFVTGEAGVKNDANGHAVIWTMFNRFGMLRHRVKSWSSFQIFLRLYSTTLQPILRSKGAAQRVWKNYNKNRIKYPIVKGNGVYEGTNIQKVQYKKHINLQKKSWGDIHPTIRSMVVNILRGKIPNPGIGIATEFASTRIYYKQKNGKFPDSEEWRNFTINYAKNRCKRKIKGCTWIDHKSNLDQMKNAFFIDNRFKKVPPSAIKIIFND